MRPPAGVFVHEHALLETDRVGAGTRIWAFAHVMPGAQIGRDCNVCDHVFIEGDVSLGSDVTVKNGALIFDKVTIEDEVFIGPGAVFTNDRVPRVASPRLPPTLLSTVVRRGASLGANVTILCDLTIGARAFVAAGAVVTGDVPPHGLMMGNPARRVGWVCSCGNRLPDSLRCDCGEAFRLVSEVDGLVSAAVDLRPRLGGDPADPG
jgi:UDP-2-acetamido-3-amino-2,3-dideoxy-glucuronate N-acetyltransferase